MPKEQRFYGNIFRDYLPPRTIQPFVAAYWFIKNHTDSTLNIPVVPDGCSDIIFYLNSDDQPFVVGVMSHAQLIPTPHRMELFGIRFRPAILSFLLGSDMRQLTDTTRPLSELNNTLAEKLQTKRKSNNEIIAHSNSILKSLIAQTNFHDTLLALVGEIIDSPDLSIARLALENNIHSKSLARLFYRHIGVAPKKFAGIMRFFKAHKHLLHNGLQDLVTTSLESGYFDQPHFNREYKKLTGTNPTSSTMSILYKNQFE